MENMRMTPESSSITLSSEAKEPKSQLTCTEHSGV
jgi:hypothetical protein